MTREKFCSSRRRRKTKRPSWSTTPRLCMSSTTRPEAALPSRQTAERTASLKLEFANGSRIIGIPEGADQIRSYHPRRLLMDEAAFQPEAGEAYDAAVPVCQKIVVSSAGPG